MAIAARGIEQAQGAVARATVTAVDASERVTVARAGARPVSATLAVAGGYAPRVGDAVLLACGEGGEAYVVGVVNAPREVRAEGARVEVVREDAGDVVRVRDDADRVVFEYHPGEKRSVVFAPAGDLELRADEGAIRLAARDAVEVRSEKRVQLDGPEVTARATRARIEADEAELLAKRVHTVVETALHVAGAIETRATRLVARAKNVFQDVEELAQTRAGRVRLVAEATLHVLGGRTLIKAREDVKLKGEKIYLA